MIEEIAIAIIAVSSIAVISGLLWINIFKPTLANKLVISTFNMHHS